MNLRDVDLNLLVSLSLLLHEGSVRGAARRAGVTPSAMSHTLGRLRTLFDDDLLVRAGRGLVPTPRADQLRAPLDAFLDAGQQVLAEPEFDPAALRRGFRLACTDHVVTLLLPSVEGLLATEAPGVDLHVAPITPDATDELRDGSLNAAVGVFPGAPPELRLRRLFGDRFATVCSTTHPRVQGSVTRAQFLAEQHLLVAPRGTPGGFIDRLLAEHGEQRRVARTLPHFLSALWHVQGSELLLTISERLALATATAIPLQILAPPLPLRPYAMRLAWHPRLHRSGPDRWFRDLLVRAAAELPELQDRSAPLEA